MLVQSRTGPPSGRPGFKFSPFITRVDYENNTEHEEAKEELGERREQHLSLESDAAGSTALECRVEMG